MIQTQVFGYIGSGTYAYFISLSEKRGAGYDVWERISENYAIQVGIQNGSLKRIPDSQRLCSKGEKVIPFYIPLVKS